MTRKSHRSTSRSGVGMVEILFASCILATFGIGAYNLLTQSFSWASHLHRKQRAQGIAQGILRYYLTFPLNRLESSFAGAGLQALPPELLDLFQVESDFQVAVGIERVPGGYPRREITTRVEWASGWGRTASVTRQGTRSYGGQELLDAPSPGARLKRVRPDWGQAKKWAMAALEEDPTGARNAVGIGLGNDPKFEARIASAARNATYDAQADYALPGLRRVRSFLGDPDSFLDRKSKRPKQAARLPIVTQVRRAQSSWRETRFLRRAGWTRDEFRAFQVELPEIPDGTYHYSLEVWDQRDEGERGKVFGLFRLEGEEGTFFLLAETETRPEAKRVFHGDRVLERLVTIDEEENLQELVRTESKWIRIYRGTELSQRVLELRSLPHLDPSEEGEGPSRELLQGLLEGRGLTRSQHHLEDPLLEALEAPFSEADAPLGAGIDDPEQSIQREGRGWTVEGLSSQSCPDGNCGMPRSSREALAERSWRTIPKRKPKESSSQPEELSKILEVYREDPEQGLAMLRGRRSRLGGGPEIDALEGRLLAGLGQHKAAAAIYQRLGSQSSDPQLLKDAVGILLQAWKTQAAEDMLAKFERASPKDPQVAVFRRSIELQRGSVAN